MVSLPVQWLRAVSDDTALVHDELCIWHERETWVSRNNLSFDLNLLNLLHSVVPANPYNVHTPSCLSESPPRHVMGTKKLVSFALSVTHM